MTSSNAYLNALRISPQPPSLKAANASLNIPRYLFDRRDHELIRLINAAGAAAQDLEYIRKRYYRHFHPHGIKEMAESRSLRIAYAMVHLLTSLEVGGMDDRLDALRSLRAEVLDTAEGPMPKNTARVLMQIMKEAVRAGDDPLRQLELVHDFRITASGKPRRVRKQLRTHHLLEMPEEWNQISFDDHVHDINTKGRKSSTHLIMDAWIKGIRRLRVVHYNYIEPRFAAELAEAARIMEIDIRIGIEFYTNFRGKYINLIWVPRGFPDTQAFLCFLEEPAVAALMNEGRRASQYQQAHVMTLLETFNLRHLPAMNANYGIDMVPIDATEFIAFVGIGQKSVLHLEKFIEEKMRAALQVKAEQLRQDYAATDDADQRKRIEAWFERMDPLDLEAVVADYLKPANNPNIPDHSIPSDAPDVPSLLKLSPAELLSRLAALQSGYRITLNLTHLQVEDVLELLYDCNGMITRLELFNLKDWANGHMEHIPAISRLQETINGHNPIKLKRLILEIVQLVEERKDPAETERAAKLRAILHDIASLQAMYQVKALKARIGSDSTGRTPRAHGMGLAVIETLPRRARKQIAEDMGTGRDRLPIHISVYRRHTYVPTAARNYKPQGWGKIPQSALPWWLGTTRKVDWQVEGRDTRMTDQGNVVTLGGVRKSVRNDILLAPPKSDQRRKIPLRHINSHLRNFAKVFIGFVPAFTTFYLTKEWWLLAYLGAFIWFGITGVRNILQSVLGGGGLKRSPMLRWNAYVSWDRIADSLLFTGFSVPLLDYLTKTVLLERGLGITTASAPVLLYTIMAVVNGLYLSTHNALRGLPKEVVLANFFRSALSIPIAIGLNVLAGQILSAAGALAVTDVLQKWAAIISKAASDLMAGIIEGTSDRYTNIRTRFRDYRQKISQLLFIYAQLELLFPETDAYDLFESNERFRQKAHLEARDLEKVITIHALDLLYFWMYQPRARSALDQLLSNINEEERHLLVTSQLTLLRQRDISQMFIDGMLGHDFARSLAFYLSRYTEYLEAMKKYV